MRRSVTLQSRDAGVNEYGELSESWSDVGTLGARIRSFSLSESVALNRESTSRILQFDFSYGPTSIAITTSNRLVFGGDNYYVMSVENVDAFNVPNGKIVRVTAEYRT